MGLTTAALPVIDCAACDSDSLLLFSHNSLALLILRSILQSTAHINFGHVKEQWSEHCRVPYGYSNTNPNLNPDPNSENSLILSLTLMGQLSKFESSWGPYTKTFCLRLVPRKIFKN